MAPRESFTIDGNVNLKKNVFETPTIEFAIVPITGRAHLVLVNVDNESLDRDSTSFLFTTGGLLFSNKISIKKHQLSKNILSKIVFNQDHSIKIMLVRNLQQC